MTNKRWREKKNSKNAKWKLITKNTEIYLPNWASVLMMMCPIRLKNKYKMI